MNDAPPGGASFAYQPELDGLRAVAVTVVVAFHTGALAHGYLGVDVFFVLSGFLVTRLLLADLATEGTVRLRRFYARRVRRLAPAAALALLGCAVVVLLVSTVPDRAGQAADIRWAGVHLANWHFVREGTGYFSSGTPSVVQHFWSLSVEEQFYALYPLVALAAWRLAGRRALIGALVVAFVGSLAMQFALDPDAAYLRTDARGYQLVAGAILAVTGIRIVRGAAWWVLGCALALAALMVPALGISTSWRGVGTMLVTVVGLAALGGGHVGGRVLSWRPLVALGRVSYGVYLWHWPVWLVVDQVADLRPWAAAAVVGAVAVTVAAGSHRFVEQPIRTATVLDVQPRRTIGAGLALGPVAVIVTSIVLAGTQPSLLRVGRFDPDEMAVVTDDVRVALGPSPRGDAWASLSDDELSEAAEVLPCTPSDPADCLRHRSSSPNAPTVLLVGDSFGFSMLPYLDDFAQRHDVTFYAAVTLGCPWVDLGLWPDTVHGPPTACGSMRTGWSTEMTAALDPDVVLLVNADSLLVPDQTRDLTGTAVGRLIVRTVRTAASSGAHVVIVENPPSFPADPVACLADVEDVADCTIVDRSDEGTTTQLLRSLVGGKLPITTVDLDDLVCRAEPLCPPYANGRFVYGDVSHVLPSWWMAQRSELDERLTVALDLDVTSGADASG